ncbi:MAG: SusD/RagB family nutrient-binding outer membrane lipoprotein [Mucilaginibacter polytrichastri]|nr:SusD/RagB family nutrient-binding outer membrane lipoprotein [Mucilaginibacter polytrichastri]
MKKKFLYITSALLALNVGCSKEHIDEVSTNPLGTTEQTFDPNSLLPTAQWGFSNTGYTRLLFQAGFTQTLASTFDYYGNGDKYFRTLNTTDYINNLWNDQYLNASRAYEMMNLTQDRPELSNTYNIGVIMKVLMLNQLTDVYGDIPYSQALQAKAGITQPAYDTQQSIYTSMLNELETATTALDASKAGPSSDLFYKGNIAQWKRFGYSLMLRVAMRLTKVDPALAKTWAEKAAAGGTFTSVADDAKTVGDQGSGFSNATANAIRTPSDFLYVKWSKTLIDYMKTNSDPRLSAVAEVPAAGLDANGNQDLAGDNTAANQIGLPNGYTIGGLRPITARTDYPGGTGTGNNLAVVGKYSRPKTAVYLDRSGINMVFTYAQTELLLAEAKVRGWNVGATSAAQHFSNGVQAAMASLAEFNAAGTVPATSAAAYAAAHPLNVTSTAASLNQINTEYWVATATFFDFIENWINWRRSGYPVLTPVQYPGNFSNNTIPRRLPYHSLEPSNNPSGYSTAVGRLQGRDEFTSRVWWDVAQTANQ